MTREELLSELRFVLKDTAIPYLWSDITLFGYLTEGQDKFCEDTGYFVDKTNYTITLQTGVYSYAISDRIIQILDIYNGRTKLSKVYNDDISTVDDEWAFNTEQTGMPVRWYTDYSTGYVELEPTPTASQNGSTLKLHVWRYSRYALDHQTNGIYDKEPEVPDRFRRACIEWAAYKAFNHHDADAQDPVKSANHLQEYRRYVLDGKRALQRIQNMETRVGFAPAYRT